MVDCGDLLDDETYELFLHPKQNYQLKMEPQPLYDPDPNYSYKMDLREDRPYCPMWHNSFAQAYLRQTYVDASTFDKKAHSTISPQYITKDRINVTILNVIDPSHFVVKETPNLANAASEAMKFSEAEKYMQGVYDCMELEFFPLPATGTMIVVLHEGKFYRAKIMSILQLVRGFLFKVYLVDYGIQCAVTREYVYRMLDEFLSYPFQAVTFELLGIEPISLVLDKITLDSSYGPVSDWDTSAFKHIVELQTGMSNAYIEVQGIQDLKIYGKLFICYETSPTVCVNDELISKSYARFNEECWKNIKSIESAMGKPDVEENLDNENPEQVPCAPKTVLAESYFGDIRIQMVMPAPKIVPLHSSSEKLQKETGPAKEVCLKDSENKKETGPAKEVCVKDSENQKETGPAKEVCLKDSEDQARRIFPKHIQKIFDNAPPMFSESSQTNVCSSEIHSPDSVISNKFANFSVNEDKGNLNMSSPIKHNSSLIYQNTENVKRNLSGESPVHTESKHRSKTEQKAGQENKMDVSEFTKWVREVHRQMFLNQKKACPKSSESNQCQESS